MRFGDRWDSVFAKLSLARGIFYRSRRFPRIPGIGDQLIDEDGDEVWGIHAFRPLHILTLVKFRGEHTRI